MDGNSVEEISEKDKEIKQLQEEIKDNDKSEELIEKTLISRSLCYFIEGVLLQYLSHRDMEDISKYSLKALASMLGFSKDELHK